MNSSSPNGFTLIELLVVVTIIVLLLAMLTPALDKAIYSAELAVCGSHLHGIGLGSQSYALNNKRYYPNRPAVNFASDRAIMLNYIYTADPTLDERDIIREYISINGHLNDPLTRKIDLDGTDSTTIHYSPYGLWYGWQYHGPSGPEKGMLKIGDRFTLTQTGTNNQSSVDTFRVLGGDYDAAYTDNNNFNAHPDHDGIAYDRVIENNDFVVGLGIAAKVTWSIWQAPSGVHRSLVDSNYVFDDGSVQRYYDVAWDDGDPTNARSTERFVWAMQNINEGSGDKNKVQLPKR